MWTVHKRSHGCGFGLAHKPQRESSDRITNTRSTNRTLHTINGLRIPDCRHSYDQAQQNLRHVVGSQVTDHVVLGESPNMVEEGTDNINNAHVGLLKIRASVGNDSGQLPGTRWPIFIMEKKELEPFEQDGVLGSTLPLSCDASVSVRTYVKTRRDQSVTTKVLNHTKLLERVEGEGNFGISRRGFVVSKCGAVQGRLHRHD